MRRGLGNASLFVLATVMALASACGGDDGDGGLPSVLHCNASDLEAALGAAGPGDSVGVGNCSIEGHFIVPAGVTLIGASQSQSKIIGTSGERAVSLETSSTNHPTAAKSLTITSDYRGIRAESSGSGEVVVENVTIEITEGAAAAFISIPVLRLDNVTMTGPVEPPDDINFDPDTFDVRPGLTLLDVESAQLTDVTVNRMTDFGAYISNSHVVWTGGDIGENLRVGINISGGSLEINGVVTTDTINPPSAGVFAYDTVVTGSGLIAEGNDRGFTQLGGTAHLTDCQLNDNNYAGAVTAEGEVTCLERCSLDGNLANGVYAFGSTSVELIGTTVTNTQTINLLGTMAKNGPFAYGAQLVDSTTGLIIKDVDFIDNEIAGALIDTSDPNSFDAQSFDNVSVDGSGDSYGVILQSYNNDIIRSPDDQWDSNLLRMGSTSLNDLSLNDPLLIDDVTVGITTPDI